MKINAIKANGVEYDIWATSAEVEELNNAGNAALGKELSSGKQLIAQAINDKGGTASADESLAELAQDVREIPTSGVLSDGIVQSEPFKFLDYVCKLGAHPFTEIDDDTITTIDRNECFNQQTNLLKVKMTALTTIDCNKAFQNCTALQSVNMPNLTSMSSQYLFENCTALQSVNMPNLTSIPYRSFLNCSSLKEVVMTNVTSAALSTFEGCSSLQEVNLPNLNTTGGTVFRYCSSLQEVNLPNLVNISGANTFTGCSLLCNVVFGQLEKIYSEPFVDSKPNLRNVTIGQDTNINLPFQNWTATNVIAEGQSAIDELNANLQTNLISKLYQGGNKILRLGAELYDVTTQETRDMVTTKGWTLQRG